MSVERFEGCIFLHCVHLGLCILFQTLHSTWNKCSYLGSWLADTRVLHAVFCPFLIPKPPWIKSKLISEKDCHKCYTLLLTLHECYSGQPALSGALCWGAAERGIISSWYLNSSFCVPVLPLMGCTSRLKGGPKLVKSLKTCAVTEILRWVQ